LPLDVCVPPEHRIERLAEHPRAAEGSFQRGGALAGLVGGEGLAGDADPSPFASPEVSWSGNSGPWVHTTGQSHLRFPVIVGIGVVTPPDPSPIPDPCQSAFPVVVPEGSRFMPGGTFIWCTNKTYPPAIRAALEASGYHFRSHHPMEDFLKKMVEVRVEIWSLDWSTLVAEYSFDPRENARLVQTRDFDGKTPEGPYSNPALGIDYTAEQMQRMPLVGFPVRAGPLPEGTPTGMYWAAVYWTLSESHNDGLNIEDFNFLPGGVKAGGRAAAQRRSARDSDDTKRRTRSARALRVPPSAMRCTMALPTTTPSASLPTTRAWAGVPTPKPTTTGTVLRARTAFTFAPRSAGSEARAPVTPVTETK
jgi:hypothetical protein